MSVHLSACLSVSIISYLFAFCRRKAEALLNMLKTNRKEGREKERKKQKTQQKESAKSKMCVFLNYFDKNCTEFILHSYFISTN